MGITVINPPSFADGTDEDDIFIINDNILGGRTVDGKGGYDKLSVDRSRDAEGANFSVRHFNGSSELNGSISSVGYAGNGPVTFISYEHLNFVGTAWNDSFTAEIRQSAITTTLKFDAGDGTDFLFLNFSGFSSAINFQVDSGSITSSYGSFSNFEKFTVYGGAGNDVIITGDGDDFIRGGSGSNILSGGGGNDTFFTISLSDQSDGGAGRDDWTGSYGSQSAPLLVDVNDTISVNGHTVAINMETLTIGTGRGNDVVNFNTHNQSVLYGGAGSDLLRVRPLTDQVENIFVMGVSTGVLQGSINTTSFSEFERLDISGGAMDDSFTVMGLFSADQIIFDSGGGHDFLFARFESLTDATSFVVDDNGGVNTNRGQFLNFERYSVIGGSGSDIIQTGSGNDFINGGLGDDLLGGGGGNDVLADEGGNDLLDGGAGDDLLYGGTGLNTLLGGAGADKLFLDLGASGTHVDGGSDRDTISIRGSISLGSVVGIEAVEFFSGATLTLTGVQFKDGLSLNSTVSGNGILVVNMDVASPFVSKLLVFIGSDVKVTVNGTTGNDIFKLGNAIHTVNAGDGNDQIKGGNAADILNGGIGVDKINGAGGADVLTGGAGNDVFKYGNASDSGIGATADQITDFTIGSDRFNFAQIDTDAALAGDQAFTFVGSGAFAGGGTASIRYVDSGGNLLVQADVNGDGVADMEVILQGLAGGSLTAGDFVL